MSLSTGRRRVLVLAEQPAVSLEEVVKRASRDSSELLILSLGRRPTDEQRRLVREALDLGAKRRIVIDARIVPSVAAAKELAQHAREITIAAASKDEKSRLESAFLPSHPSLPGVALWKDSPAPPEDQPNGSSGSESVEALSGTSIALPMSRAVWTTRLAMERKKAILRIYMGAAPGVGKTFAMLGEGQRRRSRGSDVVVGFVETYGRPLTAEMLTGLEVVPRRRLEYKGTWFEEMDVEAIIERKPAVALVDELAHTNIPGSLRSKRWEDVVDLLAAGIEVITTINIQHTESLNDVIADITGIRQQETVADWVVDLADQVELVDMSPEALRRRMRHGNVYVDPEKSELALRRFFTLENLTALRELALMRVASKVDTELLERWTRSSTPKTRERVLICVSEPGQSEELVRRGALMAQRLHGDFMVLHVVVPDERDATRSVKIRALVEDLGGDFYIGESESVGQGILSFAQTHHVTQVVVGEPARNRWHSLIKGSVVHQLIREATDLDIHVIARKTEQEQARA